MEVNTLNLFLEVMQLGSFTDVAKKRGVAPSSISRSIAALEKELDIRLFQRSTRKLSPTEAGLVYYDRIAPLVRELESITQSAADITDEPRGTLRITAPTVYGQMYITPMLPFLLKKYTDLKIELILTDSYLDLIEERIDVAIRIGTLQDSTYIARQLHSMKFHIVASPDYLSRHGCPTVPKDIIQHECLIFPRTGNDKNWIFRNSQGRQFNIPIHGKCMITNSLSIKQCAVNGMGLALLPDWNINKEVNSGSLIKLFENYTVTATDFNAGIYLLYPSRNYMPLKTRVFIDHITENSKKK